jgi:hypothetical protein
MADRPIEFSPEIEPIVHNPIGWAQLKLAGGLQRLLLVGLIYGLAVLTFHLIIYRMSRDEVNLSRFSTAAGIVMLVVSATTIFILGTSAIKKAIHRDFTSEMIQSHRLTGMSGYTAIFGYLSGPLAQTIVLSFVNWLTCTILSILAGTAPGPSVFTPAIIFIIMGCFALMCWTATILIALSTRGAVAVTGLFVLLGMAFNSNSLQTVPALSVLFGSASFINLKGGTATMSTLILAAMASQFVLSIMFFLAAARKYHRDDVIAFTPALDYTWVLLFSALSAMGICYRENKLFNIPMSGAELRIQLFASVVLLAMISFLPVSNAARRSAEWNWHKRRDAAFAQARPTGYYFVSILCSLIVLCVLMLVLSPMREVFEQRSGPRTLSAVRLVYASAAFIFTLVTFGGIIRFVFSVTPKGIFATILIIFVFWLAPLLGDLSVEALKSSPLMPDDPRSLFFASSPVGTWMSVFKPLNAPIAYGLIIQAAIAVGALVLARRAAKRR